MTRHSAAVGIALLLLLLVLNIFLAPSPDTQLRIASTHGVGPVGQAALIDLLRELGYAAPRSNDAPEKWEPGSVMWLIEPRPQDRLRSDSDGVIGRLMEWVEDGGTAVVFGEPSGGWSPLELESAPFGDHELQLEPGARRITLSDAHQFADNGDYEVVLGDPDGGAFVVSSEHGSGRIVAVADGRFLMNAHLADLDASVVALDLVRRFGSPVIDDYFHGLRDTRSFLSEAGGGRVAVVMLPLLLLIVAAARARSPWTPRAHHEVVGPEPTLANYVDALSSHYATTRDTAAAFEAYREGFLHRLRRQTTSAEGADDAGFRRRLEADPRLDSETRRWLFGSTRPENSAQLLRAVRRLEQFAEGKR